MDCSCVNIPTCDADDLGMCRSSLIQASRGWRRGVRTHIALDIPNPAGSLFQVSLRASCAQCKCAFNCRIVPVRCSHKVCKTHQLKLQLHVAIYCTCCNASSCQAMQEQDMMTILSVLQVGRHEHNESYAYYRNISQLNMTSSDGRADDLRSVGLPSFCNTSYTNMSADQCML